MSSEGEILTYECEDLDITTQTIGGHISLLVEVLFNWRSPIDILRGGPHWESVSLHWHCPVTVHCTVQYQVQSSGPAIILNEFCYCCNLYWWYVILHSIDGWIYLRYSTHPTFASWSDLFPNCFYFQKIKRSKSCGQDSPNCNINIDRKKIKS